VPLILTIKTEIPVPSYLLGPPHVSSLPTQLPSPYNCVQNKRVNTFHRFRVLSLCCAESTKNPANLLGLDWTQLCWCASPLPDCTAHCWCVRTVTRYGSPFGVLKIMSVQIFQNVWKPLQYSRRQNGSM
jgi:hypothetical protein